MNQHLIIKSADLVISPTRGELDIRSVLHALPQGKGWVFGLFSLEHKDENLRERIAHILQSHLEHLAADLAEDANVVRRFEQALSRVNRDLSRTAKDINVPLERFNAVFGVLSRGQIFLSGLGNLQTLFLHKTAERRYVIYELDAQFASQEQTWDKPFVAVLDGELHASDVFYLATPVGRHMLGMDELQDILVTLPPAGALQRIHQYLPATEHYGAIAFHAMEEDKTGIVRKANPISSLQELDNTQQHTANVLGDQQPDLVNVVKEVASGLGKKLAQPGVRNAKTTAKRILALLIKATSVIASLIAKGYLTISEILRRKFSAKKSSWARQRGLNKTHDQTKPSFGDTARQSFRELTAPRRLALLGFMAAMVIFGGILFIGDGQAEKKKSETSFASAVKTVEDNVLAANASLIYKNTAEAQAALDKAAITLETLPRDTNEHTAETERLAKELANLQAKIRGVTLVDPTQIADLHASEPSATFVTATATSSGIIAVTDSLSTYKLNLSNQAWARIETINGPLARITASAPFGADVIVVDSTQQLGRLNIAGLSLNPITSGTNGMASVDDITTYNDALYALTAASQQIVKMRSRDTNFEAGTAWISVRNTDLSTARALAIDSDIYVLLANGVVKFSSGREQNWHTNNLSPALADPADLWTALESNYLYILDPNEKRVIVLNKQSGDVVAQYVSDKFVNAIGFSIEEAASKITVITTTEALEFTPQHLVK